MENQLCCPHVGITKGQNSHMLTNSTLWLVHSNRARKGTWVYWSHCTRAWTANRTSKYYLYVFRYPNRYHFRYEKMEIKMVQIPLTNFMLLFPFNVQCEQFCLTYSNRFFLLQVMLPCFQTCHNNDKHWKSSSALKCDTAQQNAMFFHRLSPVVLMTS